MMYSSFKNPIIIKVPVIIIHPITPPPSFQNYGNKYQYQIIIPIKKNHAFKNNCEYVWIKFDARVSFLGIKNELFLISWNMLFQICGTENQITCWYKPIYIKGGNFLIALSCVNPLMPNGAFNICCPKDCVSRTANVERTARH